MWSIAPWLHPLWFLCCLSTGICGFALKFNVKSIAFSRPRRSDSHTCMSAIFASRVVKRTTHARDRRKSVFHGRDDTPWVGPRGHKHFVFACNPCLFNYLHLNNLKIALLTPCASCGWLPSNFSVEKVFHSLISHISLTLPVLGSN